MKNNSWKFYIICVLIPSVIFFLLFFNGSTTILEKSKEEEVRVEILQEATAIITHFLQNEFYIEKAARYIYEYNDEQVKTDFILERTKENLSYLHDLFVVDEKGIITNSTDPTSVGINASNKNNILFLKNYNETYTTLSDNESTFVKNIVCTPISHNDCSSNSYLIATFNIEQMINEELQIGKNLNNLLIVNKFDTPILGNFTLQEKEDIDTYSVFNGEWEIYYSVSGASATDKIVSILFSFILSFLLFHLFYLYLIIKGYKQKSIVDRLTFLEQFAAGVAHEIKNPLTAIKGFADMIQENEGKQDNTLYFETIRQEIHKINQISSEFLVLGKPVLQDNKVFLLQECIENAIEVLKTEAQLKNIEIVTETERNEIFFKGDDKHINQVILNIGKNAIEASKPGDTICFSLSKKHEEYVQIEIIDQGCGINKEDINKLFIPFHTTKETGSGLGMAICQKIIDAYDGDIKIISHKGKGTKVTIKLPIHT